MATPVYRVAGLNPDDLGLILIDQLPEMPSIAPDTAPVQSAFATVLALLPESDLRTRLYNAARTFRKQQKLPEHHFANELNDPVCEPLRLAIEQWLQEKSAYHQGEFELKSQYKTLLNAQYRQIQQLAQREDVQRALCFASHDLLRSIPAFCQKSVETFTKSERHTALGLVQYLTRMTFKTTPLSRFATVGVASHGDELPDFMSPPSAVTPNVALLEAMYAVLIHQPVFRHSLTVRLNPSIVRVESAQYRWLFFTGEQESIQQCPSNPVLNFLVETLISSNHQSTFQSLSKQLLDALDDTTTTAVEQYLEELADIGLLEWVYPETGMQPNWAGKLYQYLGFLPGGSSVKAIADMAFLLQWLRTAARTIPFQSPETAMQTMVEAQMQINAVLTKHGGAMPSIRPEQVFYEDVSTRVKPPLSQDGLEKYVQQFRQYWSTCTLARVSGMRAELYQAARQAGDNTDLLTFLKYYFEHRPFDTSNLPELEKPKTILGMMFQPFYEADGRQRLVLNGLFSGGGKLMARWMHILPEWLNTELKTWSNQVRNNAIPVAFSWQGWYNANFQPPLMEAVIGLPDGRVGAPRTYRLGELTVRQVADGIGLFYGDHRLIINDLGLENVTSRPPAIQAVLLAGLPRITTSALPVADAQITDEGILFYPRIEHEDWVIRRARWEIPETVWQEWLRNGADIGFWQRLQTAWRSLGFPQSVWGHTGSEGAQFFDLASPILVKVLEKKLKNASGNLILEEAIGDNIEVCIEVLGQ